MPTNFLRIIIDKIMLNILSRVAAHNYILSTRNAVRNCVIDQWQAYSKATCLESKKNDMEKEIWEQLPSLSYDLICVDFSLLFYGYGVKAEFAIETRDKCTYRIVYGIISYENYLVDPAPYQFISPDIISELENFPDALKAVEKFIMF